MYGREEILFLDRDYPMVDNQNQSLKFSEPYIKTFQTHEVTKLFFPRLIDRCRGQRKALSYKPVGQFGLTLIGAYIIIAHDGCCCGNDEDVCGCHVAHHPQTH